MTHTLLQFRARKRLKLPQSATSNDRDRLGETSAAKLLTIISKTRTNLNYKNCKSQCPCEREKESMSTGNREKKQSERDLQKAVYSLVLVKLSSAKHTQKKKVRDICSSVVNTNLTARVAFKNNQP